MTDWMPLIRGRPCSSVADRATGHLLAKIAKTASETGRGGVDDLKEIQRTYCLEGGAAGRGCLATPRLRGTCGLPLSFE